MPLSSLPLQLSPICSSCGMTKPLSHQKQCVEKQTNKQNSRFFRWPIACRWIVCWIPASSEKMETSRLWTVNIIIIRWAVHLNWNSLSPPYPLTDEATQLHCTPWQPVDASTPSCSSDHKKEFVYGRLSFCCEIFKCIVLVYIIPCGLELWSNLGDFLFRCRIPQMSFPSITVVLLQRSFVL